MSAKLIEVIEVEEHDGTGTAANPHRIVRRYWSKAGDLLATDDPFQAQRDDCEHEWVTPGIGETSCRKCVGAPPR